MSAGRDLLARLAPLLACLGLLAIWQAASLALHNDSFPTALQAIGAVPSILGDKEALLNILASLQRMAIGFGVAVAVSIPLGLLMGRSRAVASFFNPLLMVIYPVPKAALMPIIMLWLGVGDITKTLVIFLGVSLPVIFHSFQGAKAVEEKMLWSGAAMGLNAAQRMDTVGNKVAKAEIAMIKIVAPTMALRVIDWAIQVFGGMGVSQDTPLASMWAHQRTLRLADGPDEVHRNSLAKLELAKHMKLPGGVEVQMPITRGG